MPSENILFLSRKCSLIIKFLLIVDQTSVALGIELDDKMPQHEYYEYFGPDYTLHVAPSNMENKNSRHLLDEIRAKLLDNLSRLQHAPSVPFQERPPDAELLEVGFASADQYNTLFFSTLLVISSLNHLFK